MISFVNNNYIKNGYKNWQNIKNRDQITLE
jgi:hypothetical protein